jgi:hypothetical protein
LAGEDVHVLVPGDKKTDPGTYTEFVQLIDVADVHFLDRKALYMTERVYAIEAAHNPEVAGSNPAPASVKRPRKRGLLLRLESEMRQHPKPQTRMNKELGSRQLDLRTGAPFCVVTVKRKGRREAALPVG